MKRKTWFTPEAIKEIRKTLKDTTATFINAEDFLGAIAEIERSYADIDRLEKGLIAFREYFKSRHENGYDEEDIEALIAIRNILGGDVVIIERVGEENEH